MTLRETPCSGIPCIACASEGPESVGSSGDGDLCVAIGIAGCEARMPAATAGAATVSSFLPLPASRWVISR